MDLTGMTAMDELGYNDAHTVYEFDIDKLLETMKYEFTQADGLESFKFIDDTQYKQKDLISDMPDMDLDFLDAKYEDDTIRSCDTTLSAIEAVDMGLNIDLDEMLMHIEKNYNQVVAAGDEMLTEFELKPLEIIPYEAKVSRPTTKAKTVHHCSICNIDLSCKSNLTRHLKLKKHKQNLLALERAMNLECEPSEMSQQHRPLTLSQMTDIDFNFVDEIIMDESGHYKYIGKFPDPRRNKYSGDQNCMKRRKRLYRCAKCPKVFTNASNLKRHERLHDDSKLHACKCGKTFHIKEYLKKHQIVHEKERMQMQ